MKQIIISALLLGFVACSQPTEKIDSLQTQVDSLQVKLNNAYKPDLDEFMIGIQSHHIKLWYAGNNENWKLANFEVKEIVESFDEIEHFVTERSETKLVPMIRGAIESVNAAIEQQDLSRFKDSYSLMTNVCNQCHLAAQNEFNLVKIPDSQPFSDQDFAVKTP